MPELSGMPTQDPLVIKRLRASLAQGKSFGSDDLNREIQALVQRDAARRSTSAQPAGQARKSCASVGRSKSAVRRPRSAAVRSPSSRAAPSIGSIQWRTPATGAKSAALTRHVRMSGLGENEREVVEMGDELDAFERRLAVFDKTPKPFTRPPSAAYYRNRSGPAAGGGARAALSLLRGSDRFSDDDDEDEATGDDDGDGEDDDDGWTDVEDEDDGFGDDGFDDDGFDFVKSGD
jgi:hypothetical protein